MTPWVALAVTKRNKQLEKEKASREEAADMQVQTEPDAVLVSAQDEAARAAATLAAAREDWDKTRAELAAAAVLAATQTL